MALAYYLLITSDRETLDIHTHVLVFDEGVTDKERRAMMMKIACQDWEKDSVSVGFEEYLISEEDAMRMGVEIE